MIAETQKIIIVTGLTKSQIIITFKMLSIIELPMKTFAKLIKVLQLKIAILNSPGDDLSLLSMNNILNKIIII